VTSAGGRLLSVLLPCTRRQSGGPNIRLRRKSMSRTMSDSSSRMDPGAPTHISLMLFSLHAFHKDHVFMSINPPNGLELSNLAHRATVDQLREHIFSMWPSGVEHQHHDGHDWHVTFAGRPWDPKGHQSILFVSSNTSTCCIDLSILYRSQRMICRVFSVLAAQVRYTSR
jgi:hypothetical protein